MGKGAETREDANHAVLSEVRNKACAQKTRQEKNPLCIGLPEMWLQKQTTSAEARTHTESDRARSTRNHRDYWEERTETASFAHNAH